MPRGGKRNTILARGAGSHEWRGLRLGHGAAGWYAGVPCTFGEGYGSHIHGHYLTPDPAHPGQYRLTSEEHRHHWPTEREAQAALDAWESQPQADHDGTGDP